jgi:hypothetical protein
MAEVTLGDYAGYIYLEMIKARELADGYSKMVAERYRQDPVLEHFSVPRFKIPRAEITIPVLVSGVRIREIVRFSLNESEFQKKVVAEMEEVARQIYLRLREPLPDLPDLGAESIKLALRMRTELAGQPQRRGFESIVMLRWPTIFLTAIGELRIQKQYEKVETEGELAEASLNRMIAIAGAHMVVDSTRLESLLVDPETNVVKNGSDGNSVFVIKAEIVEESFFLRTITDPDTGDVRPIVEFE